MDLSLIKSCQKPSFIGPYVDINVLKEALKNPGAPPSLAGSDVSSDSASCDSVPDAPPRLPLQWEFKGLTLWLEYDEYDGDLSKAIDDAATKYGTERIPMAHSTVIYGMEHLSENEAAKLLHQVPTKLFSSWPLMDAPRGITVDISTADLPGQVCAIGWAELTFATNAHHETSVDALYQHFGVERIPNEAWTPHISLAYDNPADTVLRAQDFCDYACGHTTLMQSRRVRAMSLWSTRGKMAEWRCLDRIYFENN
jgi:hypothetical protein